jgi:hypothetical protein
VFWWCRGESKIRYYEPTTSRLMVSSQTITSAGRTRQARIPQSLRSTGQDTTLDTKKGTPLDLTTPLPDYSPHLPPVDRTKWGRSFFEDLRAKRLIEDYDDKRWTCWCHAAKKNQRRVPRTLSLSHQKSEVQESSRRYVSRSWFLHAARCHFYRVSGI